MNQSAQTIIPPDDRKILGLSRSKIKCLTNIWKFTKKPIVLYMSYGFALWLAYLMKHSSWFKYFADLLKSAHRNSPEFYLSYDNANILELKLNITKLNLNAPQSFLANSGLWNIKSPVKHQI